MSFESGLSFLIAVFIFGITPGPGVFAILARALIHGARSCLALSIGMIISDIVYLIAACFGLAAIATHYGEVFFVIRIVGALYLLYLGYKMWTAPVNFDLDNADQKQLSKRMGFLQGFLISASNPKVLLFYIAFLPTFMDLTVLSGTDIAIASVLTFVGLLAGLMLIATFARARVWFQSERAVKGLNRSAGSLMIGAAAYLAGRS